MRDDKAIATALKAINKARAYMGLDPIDQLVPGRRHKPESCPISRSVRSGYTGRKFRVSTASTGILVYLRRAGHEHYAPPVKIFPGVSNFVRRFDQGLIPKLSSR